MKTSRCANKNGQVKATNLWTSKSTITNHIPEVFKNENKNRISPNIILSDIYIVGDKQIKCYHHSGDNIPSTSPHNPFIGGTGNSLE